MKKTKQILLLTMLLTFSTYSFAQSILDSNNDTVAVVNNGLVVNSIGDPVGEFLTNGQVKNNIGELIGSIEGIQFKNLEGVLIGYLDENNNVYDINGDQIGSVQSQTIVYDSNNMIIGTSTSAIEPTKLAAYFFFFFNQIF